MRGDVGGHDHRTGLPGTVRTGHVGDAGGDRVARDGERRARGECDVARQDVRGHVAGLHAARLGTSQVSMRESEGIRERVVVAGIFGLGQKYFYYTMAGLEGKIIKRFIPNRDQRLIIFGTELMRIY